MTTYVYLINKYKVDLRLEHFDLGDHMITELPWFTLLNEGTISNGRGVYEINQSQLKYSNNRR